jgi:hypothetical protein
MLEIVGVLTKRSAPSPCNGALVLAPAAEPISAPPFAGEGELVTKAFRELS